MQFRAILAAAVFCAATVAQADLYTTAAEVRPILEAGRARWITIQEYDSHDILFFTGIIQYRCGVSRVDYAVNGTAPLAEYTLQPCYEGTAQPNAQKADAVEKDYVLLPFGSIETVHVVVTLDDGTTIENDFNRLSVLEEEG